MRATHFKTFRLAASLLGLACLATGAQAAISVGPAGSGNLNFTTPIDTALPATDWSTLSVGASGAGVHTTAATLDAAVIANTSAAAVVAALAQTPTIPVTQLATARHNTNQTSGYFLQTRPTGNEYTILMGTFQNDSGADQAQVCLAYDFGQQSAPPVNESPELAGHRIFYSVTGTPGSWLPVTGIATPDLNFVSARVSATITLGTWAQGSPLYIIWVDDNGPGSTTNPQEGGYTLDNMEISFACAPPPPVGISDASSITNQNVLQCRSSATMSVTASNAAGYQWVKDGADITGATAPTFTIANMQATDAGDYFARVSGVGGPVVSPTATISYTADTVPPTIVYAICNTNLTNITVTFNEAIDTNATFLADALFNFVVTDTTTGLDVTKILVEAPNNTSLRITTDPRDPSHAYTITLVGVTDACAGNLLADTTIGVSCFETCILPLDATWKYDQSGTDLGTAWRATNFDDSAWLSGPATFDGKRTNATSLPPLCRPALLNGEPVRTCLTLSNALSIAQLQTYYFRTHFTYNGALGLPLRLRTLLDDGAVFYLNGVELTRAGMAAGTVAYTTFANRTVGDANFEDWDAAAPSLVVGDNVLAAELHQVNLTSSDVTMALKLMTLNVEPPLRLSIVLNLDGSVTVTWPGGTGTLVCTSDPSQPLASWTAVAGAVSPHTFAAGTLAAHQFYAVRVP